MLPVTPLQVEQVWLTQAVPIAPQSASTQQLPGVQLLLQQKSLVLAAHAMLLLLQARVTHLPWFAPAAVSQMKFGP